MLLASIYERGHLDIFWLLFLWLGWLSGVVIDLKTIGSFLINLVLSCLFLFNLPMQSFFLGLICRGVSLWWWFSLIIFDFECLQLFDCYFLLGCCWHFCFAWLSFSVLFHLRFNMLQYYFFFCFVVRWVHLLFTYIFFFAWLAVLGLYFALLFCFNFRFWKTFLVASSIVLISIWVTGFGLRFSSANLLYLWCFVWFCLLFCHGMVQYLSLTIVEITFVLNTSYLKIPGHDYQLLVQA